MAAFIGGYAIVWSGFGLAAFGARRGAACGRRREPVAASAHDWWIGGAVLALAGAFQFTSLKDACLDKCRHPASS